MSSLNLNKVILVGRLTADPELKQTQSGTPVVTFTVAVNRNYTSKSAESGQPTADFISTVAWRQHAEFICRYFKKGNSICVIGSIQTRNWTDQNNTKRYVTEVVVEEVRFVDSKSDSGSFSAAQPQMQYAPESYGTPTFSNTDASAPRFEEITGDDDLPF